jgi:hypothetical protein
MEEAASGSDDAKQRNGFLGRVGRNTADLFALGSAFLAAALPAAEFVKGIYELKAKAREHADQVELELATTGPCVENGGPRLAPGEAKWIGPQGILAQFFQLTLRLSTASS